MRLSDNTDTTKHPAKREQECTRYPGNIIIFWEPGQVMINPLELRKRIANTAEVFHSNPDHDGHGNHHYCRLHCICPDRSTNTTGKTIYCNHDCSYECTGFYRPAKNRIQCLAACDHLGTGIGQQQNDNQDCCQQLHIAVFSTAPVCKHSGITQLILMLGLYPQWFMQKQRDQKVTDNPANHQPY